jgi:hypothetical protein
LRCSLFCHAFATGELLRNQTNYQADRINGYFLTVAQRYENLLIFNFTDTNEQPRSVVEDALRESQAFVQAARAEAEQQRQRFLEVLTQMPAYIAVYQGPDHIKRLLENGGASITLSSEPGIGTTFTVTFGAQGTPACQKFLNVKCAIEHSLVYQSGLPIIPAVQTGFFTALWVSLATAAACLVEQAPCIANAPAAIGGAFCDLDTCEQEYHTTS